MRTPSAYQADLVTADNARLAELEAAVPVLGASPLEIVRPKSLHGSIIDPGLRAKRHEDSDSRLLQIAAIIEKRLKRDPGIAETAKAWVERRLLSAEGSERLALREWHDLL